MSTDKLSALLALAMAPAREDVSMPKLTYTRDELLADHDYAQLQLESGYRLHGGFDANGNYISPRTLNRWPAVEAWQDELRRRGATVIDASTRLLKRGPYPTVEQQKFLQIGRASCRERV